LLLGHHASILCTLLKLPAQGSCQLGNTHIQPPQTQTLHTYAHVHRHTHTCTHIHTRAQPGASITSSSAVSAAAQKKEEGNASFRANQPAEAVSQYLEALGLISTHPALLLSNRAACFLALGRKHGGKFHSHHFESMFSDKALKA
jgi:hypothetical protein